MPHSAAHRLLPFALLGLSLVACGNTSGTTPPGSSDALSQGDAATFAQDAQESQAMLAQLLMNPASLNGLAPIAAQGQGSRLSAQAFACAVKTDPAQPVDADRDGVFLAAASTVDCSGTNDETGAGWSIKGTSHVQDKDDHDPLSGFTASVKDYTVASTDREGHTSSTTLNSSVDLTTTGGTYSLVTSLDLSARTPRGDHALSHHFNVTYTPDDRGAPRAAGTFNVMGKSSFTGPQKSVTLSVSATDLHFTKTCASHFDRGAASYTDAKGNTLKIVYTACNAVTVTYNGQAVPTS